MRGRRRRSWDTKDFARYLKQARSRFDWSKDAAGDRAVAGMSGNKAALIIAAAMAEELTDEAGSNMIKEIQEQLRAQLKQSNQAETRSG